MIAVVHVLAGAVIGMALDSIPAIVIVAFFLHYLMDLLPHIDPETFAVKRISYTWSQILTFLADVLSTISVGIILTIFHARWSYIVIGSIASLIPDILIPLERYTAFWPLRRFHCLFHWNRRYARHWSWYIAGIVTPTVFALVSTAILWLGA